MSENRWEAEFSSGASSALDEYLSNLSNKITEKAVEFSREQGDDVITIEAIARAIESVESSKRQPPLPRRVSMVRRLGVSYAFVGAIMLLLGIFLYIVRERSGFDIPLVVAFGGALTTLFGLFLARYGLHWIDPTLPPSRPVYESPRSQGDAVTEFIAQWREFERVIRTTPVDGEGLATRSTLREQLEKLVQAKIVRPDELREIIGLLTRRNDLVHGRLPVSPESVRRDALALSRLTRILRAKVLNKEPRGD